jgi:GNAT superfamily N-acetyltransferase
MIDIQLATNVHLDEVLAWLKQEQEETGESFYRNKEIIVDSFNASEMVCASVDNCVIGFGIFTRYSQGGSCIDIFEIHPAHRGKGYGRELAQHFIQMLSESRAHNISVKCAPHSSEGFWRKFGFTELENAKNWPGEPLKLTLIL